MSPSFTTIVEAVAYWRERDLTPLDAATTPPCNRLDDEIYDVVLARMFMAVVATDTVTEAALVLHNCIGANLPMIAHCRSIDREYQPEAHEAADRLQRAMSVLESWQADLLRAVGLFDSVRAA